MLIVSSAFASVDFSAAPVWVSGRECERNLTLGFRIDIKGDGAKVLRYSASSIARVWLNGEFLCYGPARGPHGIDRIDEIALEGKLKNGINHLAFEVAGYNVDSYYLLNEPAYLIAEILGKDGGVIEATGRTGSVKCFVLGERVQRVPRFSYQRPFCEVYSLTPDYADWRTGALRAEVTPSVVAGSAWRVRNAPYPEYATSYRFTPICTGGMRKRSPSSPYDGRAITGELDPRRGYSKSEVVIQPFYEILSLEETNRTPVVAKSSYELGCRDFIMFDHGFCDTGFLGLRVVCRKPGRLYFHFDEVLVSNDVNLARMKWQCMNTVTYELKRAGVYDLEAFEPNTFRYLKVLSDGFEGEISGLFVRGYKNGLAARAKFETSDRALNGIFESARETFVQNAVDVLTDCPSRERAGWLCDSYFSGRAENWLCGTNPVERCFLENYALTGYRPTREDRFLPMCYPADSGLLPNWNFWLVLELEDYLQRTGDRSLIELMRPKVVDMISSFRKYRNADGLLEKLPGWVFIEWSFANELVQDVNYPSNMTYAKMLEVAGRLYGLDDCIREAEKVRDVVRRQSWTGEWFCDNALRQTDGSLKLSGECTETCQYYAHYMGLVDKASHPDHWNRLVRDFGPRRKIDNRYPKIHLANAFIGNYLRLELLSRAGCYRQIVEETRDYFWGMAQRTGTLWEHDRISNSCDHGFASHVAVMLFRDVLGVRKVDRGNRCVTVDVDESLPLAYCRGEVPLSDKEVMRLSWRRTENGIVQEWSVPFGWSIQNGVKETDCEL